MKRGASELAMPPLAEGAVRCCDNCATTDTPLWRPERTLGMMLCNACSIWWRTKKTHRPKPSPEALAKRAAAAAAKASAVVSNPKQCPADSSPESFAQPTKRLRRARTWGDDIQVYSDSSPEQEVRGWEESAAVCRRRRAAYEEELSVEEAAEVLMSFRDPQQPPADLAEAEELPAPRKRTTTHQRDFDVSVTVSVQRKTKKVAAKDKSCLNCGITETPTWRRAGGQFPLCNACGVYWSTHGTHRVPPVQVPLQATTRPKAVKPAAAFEAAPPSPRAKIEGASPDKRRRLSPAPELALPLPPACPPVADAAVAAAPLPWPSCGLNLLPGHLQAAALMVHPHLGMQQSPTPAWASLPRVTAEIPKEAGLNRLLFPSGKDVVSINVQAYDGAFEHQQ